MHSSKSAAVRRICRHEKRELIHVHPCSSVVKFFFICVITPAGGWVENPIVAESVRGELALVYRSDQADPL